MTKKIESGPPPAPYIDEPGPGPVIVIERRDDDEWVLGRAREIMQSWLIERSAMDTPAIVQDYLQLHLGRLEHEVFGVLFLDAQHRLIEFVQMFRRKMTQTSVYIARNGKKWRKKMRSHSKCFFRTISF